MTKNQSQIITTAQCYHGYSVFVKFDVRIHSHCRWTVQLNWTVESVMSDETLSTNQRQQHFRWRDEFYCRYFVELARRQIAVNCIFDQNWMTYIFVSRFLQHFCSDGTCRRWSHYRIVLSFYLQNHGTNIRISICLWLSAWKYQLSRVDLATIFSNHQSRACTTNLQSFPPSVTTSSCES